MKQELEMRRPLDSQAYFDRLSDSWEFKYASDGSMVGRLARIVRHLKQWVPNGGRVLDFGCGAGDIAVQCGSEGYKVDALDSSPKMVARATSRFRNENIAFTVCTNTLALPYAEGSFDGIVASSVLEYVSNLQPHLRELRRVCKEGGHALFTVPNMAHPIRWMESAERCLAKLFRGRIQRTPSDREEYLALSVNRQTIREWREIFTQTGWAVVDSEHSMSPLTLIVLEKRGSAAIDSVN